MRRNSKRKIRVKKKKKKEDKNVVDFPPFLHNVKKIAFANYHSLKAIRVFGGTLGTSRRDRQSERPTQNFSSIRLYRAKWG